MTNLTSMPISAALVRSSLRAWRSRTSAAKCQASRLTFLYADHQSKADVGASIARQWFDAENVDMIIGFENSSVALAVEQVAAQKNRIAIAGAIGTTAFTGKNCTPNEAAWVYDAYALTNTLARSVVGRGEKTWFFITVDYALGHSLEADATAAVIGERRQRCWAALATRSIRRISVRTCCRRRRRALRSWRSPMPAAI